MMNQKTPDYLVYKLPFPINIAPDLQINRRVCLYSTTVGDNSVALVTSGAMASIQKRLSDADITIDVWQDIMGQIIKTSGVLAIIQPMAGKPIWVRHTYATLAPYIGLVAEYLMASVLPAFGMGRTIEMVSYGYTNEPNKKYLIDVCRQWQYMTERKYDATFYRYPRAIDRVKACHMPPSKKTHFAEFRFAADGVQYGVTKCRFPILLPDGDEWKLIAAHDQSSRLQDMPSILMDRDYYNGWLACLKSKFIAHEDWNDMIQKAVDENRIIAVHNPHERANDDIWYADGLSEAQLDMAAHFFASTVWKERYYDRHDKHLFAICGQLDEHMRERVNAITAQLRQSKTYPAGWKSVGYRADMIAVGWGSKASGKK